MKKYNCIFLDRDGTLNPDPPPGYIRNLRDFKFFDGALNALKRLSEQGNSFAIISNQSGVSRGHIKIEDLEKIHKYIEVRFKKYSIPLLGIHFCSDHPNNATSRRKPNAGMFLEAKKNHNLNLEKCLMIGDSIVDMQVGDRLKMKTIFLLTGMGNDYLNDVQSSCDVDLVSNNLLEAAKDLKLILQ